MANLNAACKLIFASFFFGAGSISRRNFAFVVVMRQAIACWQTGIYLIQERAIRRFILEHPTEIDLRKVDQLCFLDVITNGLVRAA